MPGHVLFESVASATRYELEPTADGRRQIVVNGREGALRGDGPTRSQAKARCYDRRSESHGQRSDHQCPRRQTQRQKWRDHNRRECVGTKGRYDRSHELWAIVQTSHSRRQDIILVRAAEGKLGRQHAPHNSQRKAGADSPRRYADERSAHHEEDRCKRARTDRRERRSTNKPKCRHHKRDPLDRSNGHDGHQSEEIKPKSEGKKRPSGR